MNGNENGSYYSILGYMGKMEKKMETMCYFKLRGRVRNNGEASHMSIERSGTHTNRVRV